MAQASAEKLEHTGPAEKERVASVPKREQLARTPEPPMPKRKGIEPSVQIPNHGGERVKMGKAAPWRERGRSKREHGEERVDFTVNEGRFQGKKGGQARRAFLEQVEGSVSG